MANKVSFYQIKKSVRGKQAAVRLAARCEHAAPIIAALKPWLEAQISRIPQKSPLAEDIRKAASKTSCSGASTNHQALLHRATPSRLLI